MELWKDIEDYEGLYQVSNFGNIKNIKSQKHKFLKKSLKNNKYMKVNLSKNNKLRTFAVHRLVAIAFIPNPHNKLRVNHKNGIKSDNYYENLEWVTDSENMIHAIETGLKKLKINESDIVQIFKMANENIDITEISNNFNISKAYTLSLLNKEYRKSFFETEIGKNLSYKKR